MGGEEQGGGGVGGSGVEGPGRAGRRMVYRRWERCSRRVETRVGGREGGCRKYGAVQAGLKQLLTGARHWGWGSAKGARTGAVELDGT